MCYPPALHGLGTAIGGQTTFAGRRFSFSSPDYPARQAPN